MKEDQINRDYERYAEMKIKEHELNRGNAKTISIPSAGYNHQVAETAKKHGYSVLENHPAGSTEAQAVIMLRRRDYKDDENLANLIKDLGDKGLFPERRFLFTEANVSEAGGKLKYEQPEYDSYGNCIFKIENSFGGGEEETFKKGHFIERLFDYFKDTKRNIHFTKELDSLTDRNTCLEFEINELYNKIKSDSGNVDFKELLKKKISEYMDLMDSRTVRFGNLIPGSVKYGKTFAVFNPEYYASGSITNKLKEKNVSYIVLAPKEE